MHFYSIYHNSTKSKKKKNFKLSAVKSLKLLRRFSLYVQLNFRAHGITKNELYPIFVISAFSSVRLSLVGFSLYPSKTCLNLKTIQKRK